MVKPNDSRPSSSDLEREAEAELRRAGAFGNPQPQSWTSGSDDDEYEYEEARLSPEDEARAVTGLAMQQLAERAVRVGPSRYSTPPPVAASGSPEDMRSRALAEILARQKRLARDKPVVQRPDPYREAPMVGSRARAAPILTATPMVNVARAPGVPRDSGARAPKGGGPSAPMAPAGPAPAFAERRGGSAAAPLRGGRMIQDAEAPRVTLRRGVTRRGPLRGAAAGVGDEGEAAGPLPASPAPSDAAGLVEPSGGAPMAAEDALAAASHATLSAVAVLLASMEVLPPPRAADRDQTLLYEQVTQHMTRLSALLERYLRS